MGGADQLTKIKTVNTLYLFKLGRNIYKHKLTLSSVYRSERCATIDNTNRLNDDLRTRNKK